MEALSGQPLATNRGVEVHFDYLAVTVWLSPLEAAALALRLLGLAGGLRDFERKAGGARFFRSVYVHPSGITLYAGHCVSPGCCSIEFKGSAAAIDASALKSELLLLNDAGVKWHASRLDVAADQEEVTADLLNAEWLAGRVKSHTQRESRKLVVSGCDDQEVTLYLGVRSSPRMLRTYQHEEVQRVELETHDERAHAILLDLLEHEVTEWPACMLSHILDFAEFDCPEWQRFKRGVERAKLQLSRLESSIEKMAGWLHFGVSRCMAKVREAKGAEFFEALLLHGYSKLTEADRREIAFEQSLVPV